MKWWILGAVALLGGGAAILATVSSEEKEARRRWDEKRADVEKSVEDHRRNIEEHLQEAQQSYDFYLLTNLHFSSMRVADSAYALLKDAKSSLATIYRILDQISEKKLHIKSSLTTANKEYKSKLLAELKSHNSFKSTVLEDLAKVKPQREHLEHEVKRLNQQTRLLKEAIRDRCGSKGFSWFQRLEERKAAKMISRGA